MKSAPSNHKNAKRVNQSRELTDETSQTTPPTPPTASGTAPAKAALRYPLPRRHSHPEPVRAANAHHSAYTPDGFRYGSSSSRTSVSTSAST